MLVDLTSRCWCNIPHCFGQGCKELKKDILSFISADRWEITITTTILYESVNCNRKEVLEKFYEYISSIVFIICYFSQDR